MSAAAGAKTTYLEALTATAETVAGASVPWIRDIRQQALARFAEQGFPTTRDEAWRYTSVAPIERQAFRPAIRRARPLRAQQLEAFLLAKLACQRLVFVDGYYAAELSELETFTNGVVISSLATTIERRAEPLQEHLGRYAPTDRYGFPALNTAALADGAYVHVPAGIKLERPIHLLFLATGDSEPSIVQPRNLVVAGGDSRVTVIESYVALNDARYFTNTITEVVEEEGAVIEHYKLGLESLQAYHIGGLYVHQQRDSRFASHNIAFGGALVRNNIDVTFDAEGSECLLNGLYLVSGRQHVDNHTHIAHASPRCTSREFYKGVLDGHGRAVFNGRIVVHRDAQHTDARQENKNLLLSRDAEIDTKPQLEIYADDVKCAHGATVGQLDADMLYYLRTRGIDLATAGSVLTYAFANEILTRIDIEPLRLHAQERLTARLLQGRRIEELA